MTFHDFIHHSCICATSSVLCFRVKAIIKLFLSPNRRTHGGRKLWESKDDRKWGHDKFEEMSQHERHHEEVTVVYINIFAKYFVVRSSIYFSPDFLIYTIIQGRRPSRGNFRGRGRNRGIDRGYATGNRSKEYENNNRRQVPKAVRGRGPRRYEPAVRNNRQVPSTQYRQ